MSENQQTNINGNDLYPEISVKECLLESWEMLKKHWIVLIGGYLIYLVIALSVNYMPMPLILKSIYSLVFNIFILPALIAGYLLLALNVGRDTKPKISDLFRGFHRFGTVMGFHWFISLILMVCMIPSFIFIGISVANNPSLDSLLQQQDIIALYTSLAFLKIFAFMMLNLLIIFILLVRYIMSYYILMDDPKRKVFDIFKESVFLMKGYTFNYFYLILIGALLTLVGFVCLIIPGIIMGQIAWLSHIRFYEKLKEIKRPVESIVENNTI